MRVTIDCGAPLTALVTRHTLAELALMPGCPVLVTFKTSAVHVIEQQHPAGSFRTMP
jgi:molybdopterin-binding protein